MKKYVVFSLGDKEFHFLTEGEFNHMVADARRDLEHDFVRDAISMDTVELLEYYYGGELFWAKLPNNS